MTTAAARILAIAAFTSVTTRTAAAALAAEAGDASAATIAAADAADFLARFPEGERLLWDEALAAARVAFGCAYEATFGEKSVESPVFTGLSLALSSGRSARASQRLRAAAAALRASVAG